MKKKTPQPAPGSSTPWNNPFAGLKLDLPKTPEPPPPPPPSPEEQRKAALSPEDQKLLEAFGGITLSVGHATPAKPSGPRLSFNIQRKGKGGKTVTLVYGLKELELTEQMTLGTRLQKALGTGARFEDGILQIQGDQRDRARAWFTKQGFNC